MNNNKEAEKETTRRHLMANMLCSANSGPLTTSHSRWASFWLGLRKNRGS